MNSDQGSLSVRVGHFHVQLTGVDMFNFTIDEKKIIETLLRAKSINCSLLTLLDPNPKLAKTVDSNGRKFHLKYSLRSWHLETLK